MKNIWKILSGLLLIATASYITSCVKGDFDEPPIFIPKVDFDANTTIAELKDTYTGLKLIEDDIIISGIVVANDESGNLYKKLIIQDETAGIELALDKTNLYNEFKLGQRVFVKCKDMYIGDYNNLIQLGHLFNNAIGRLPEVYIKRHVFRDSLAGPVPEPQVAAINNLNYLLISKLVKFEGVSFLEVGQEWAPQAADATNRTMIGPGGNLVVRTSRFSRFSGDLVPSGYGDVTGVLSIFGSTYQLTLRDTFDIKDFGGDTPPPPGSGTGTFDDPFDVVRAIADNSGTNVWVEGYIVGVFETDVNPFEPNFSEPFRTNSNILIAQSSDETALTNCLTVQLPAGAVRNALNLVSNATNKGKSVKIYGNLEAYFTQPGLRVATGYWMDGAGIIPGGGSGGTGSGTQADPYDIEAAIDRQDQRIAWIKGYIVGTVKDGSNSIGSNADLQLSGPFVRPTHVLLADSPTENDYTNMLAVNFPTGTALRSQVNLVDNPDNLGKWLKVTGKLTTYFAIAGLRESPGTANDFELEDNGGSTGGTAIFLEDFSNEDLGDFTTYSIIGEQSWIWAQYGGGCAYMSGYFNEINYANEDWLISPAISLTGQTGYFINFREAINYITSINDLKVLISSDYDGSSNPSTNGTWNELTGFNRAPGNSWTFFDSGDVSLSAYEGQTIYLAFKYVSTAAGSSTWEISRVEVKY